MFEEKRPKRLETQEPKNDFALPQHVDEADYKRGVVYGIADEFTFIVNLWYFSHFETEPHSPSKDYEVS